MSDPSQYAADHALAQRLQVELWAADAAEDLGHPPTPPMESMAPQMGMNPFGFRTYPNTASGVAGRGAGGVLPRQGARNSPAGPTQPGQPLNPLNRTPAYNPLDQQLQEREQQMRLEQLHRQMGQGGPDTRRQHPPQLHQQQHQHQQSRLPAHRIPSPLHMRSGGSERRIPGRRHSDRLPDRPRDDAEMEFARTVAAGMGAAGQPRTRHPGDRVERASLSHTHPYSSSARTHHQQQQNNRNHFTADAVGGPELRSERLPEVAFGDFPYHIYGLPYHNESLFGHAFTGGPTTADGRNSRGMGGHTDTQRAPGYFVPDRHFYSPEGNGAGTFRFTTTAHRPIGAGMREGNYAAQGNGDMDVFSAMDLLLSSVMTSLNPTGPVAGVPFPGGALHRFLAQYVNMGDGFGDDERSYEDWQQLIEQIGFASRGASEDEISRLPTEKFSRPKRAPSVKKASAASSSASARSPEEEPEKCPICLGVYEEGDEIKRLPCMHTFCDPCISRWLQTSKECPCCKASIRDTPNTSRRN